MTDILALLQYIAPLLEKTTFRRMNQVIFGMLVDSGLITLVGLSRRTENGGYYWTIQHFYHSVIPWIATQWLFFRERHLVPEDEYIAAGDKDVMSKAGEETHGLDRFFSSIQQRVIPSLSFFVFFSGECARRAVIFIASCTSCEKRTRKGSLQSQNRRKNGQKNNWEENAGTSEGL